ncbi:undecaprenyl-diphosphate phosphatase [Sulfidibacter corallicola]|uniref:Undecaprenyl-diphosphatase n=1 Tax=Sulfidibacter corallicola TaxID=2818388 RepID=A0A8A4TX42_SULCO|nr:undecaprenyl-diphosphate phosphatase [Sulfidibacter corallicola]QTD53768.1 undecaprenyl-diphosphate phosphatase [Sulfidibacter corallicola]
MSLGLAIFLGILQGLTEFFPVSSSGHLALFGSWFGVHSEDMTFEILVHLATLAAIMVYFRKDWVQLIKIFLGRERGDFPPHILPYLVFSMVPAGLVGIFLKDHIQWIKNETFWVGACLIVTGVTLLFGLRVKREGVPMEKLDWLLVVAMGLAQACAVLPGISRSGSTIMCALFLGLHKQAAARFSFLMAVPVIGGAGVLTLKDLLEQEGTLSTDMLAAYGAGFMAALFSGFFALAFMMRLLEGRRFFYFGFYCIPLGILAMTL